MTCVSSPKLVLQSGRRRADDVDARAIRRRPDDAAQVIAEHRIVLDDHDADDARLGIRAYRLHRGELQGMGPLAM
jgi:hypothetical protein